MLFFYDRFRIPYIAIRNIKYVTHTYELKKHVFSHQLDCFLIFYLLDSICTRDFTSTVVFTGVQDIMSFYVTYYYCCHYFLTFRVTFNTFINNKQKDL